MYNIIYYFRKEYDFLSNFHPAPIKINGITYPSSENAYMAAKTEDLDLKKHISTLSAEDAKRLGRELKLRPHWEDIKVMEMQIILHHKFIQHPELGDRLINTGNSLLIEGNWWNDNFWGVHMKPVVEPSLADALMYCSPHCPKNHLGRSLMFTREYIKVKRYVNSTRV